MNRAKLLLGWGSALLLDGRLVLPRGVVGEHADALLPRGFLWGRENGALRLVRAGATSPQVPSFFQTWSIAQLSPSGACLLTESGEIWCHGFSRSLRFEAPIEDSVGLHWYRLTTRSQKRALSVDGDSTFGCAVLDGGQADCWLGERPFALLSFPVPIVQAAVTSTGGYESGYHICLLNRDGEVGCWGSGTAGQLGYMAPAGKDVDVEPKFHALNPPRQFLRFPSPARQIFAFPDQSCALLNDGDLWCWGNTGDLQLRGQASPSEYWRRLLRSGSDTAPVATGASTLPSAPIALPAECRAQQVLPLPFVCCANRGAPSAGIASRRASASRSNEGFASSVPARRHLVQSVSFNGSALRGLRSRLGSRRMVPCWQLRDKLPQLGRSLHLRRGSREDV